MTPSTSHAASRVTARDIRRLARFRYELRRFLRFSEQAARHAGVTPLQHQLLLGVAGFTGRGSATISELSECLQTPHNAVVALVHRAERGGLIRKRRNAADRRVVDVALTPRGRGILLRLSRRHRQELARFQWHRGSVPTGSRPAPIPASAARPRVR